MNVQLSFTQQADSAIVPVNAKTKTKIIIKSLKKKKNSKEGFNAIIQNGRQQI